MVKVCSDGPLRLRIVRVHEIREHIKQVLREFRIFWRPFPIVQNITGVSILPLVTPFTSDFIYKNVK